MRLTADEFMDVMLGRAKIVVGHRDGRIVDLSTLDIRVPEEPPACAPPPRRRPGHWNKAANDEAEEIARALRADGWKWAPAIREAVEAVNRSIPEGQLWDRAVVGTVKRRISGRKPRKKASPA